MGDRPWLTIVETRPQKEPLEDANMESTASGTTRHGLTHERGSGLLIHAVLEN